MIIVRYADGCVPRRRGAERQCRSAREMRVGPSELAVRSRLQPPRAATVRAAVVNVVEQAGHDPVRYGVARRERKQTADDVSKAYRRCRNRGMSLTRDESGDGLIPAQTACGMKAA
jgi:hypothetical protein